MSEPGVAAPGPRVLQAESYLQGVPLRIEEAFIADRFTKYYDSILDYLQSGLDDVPLDHPLPPSSQLEFDLERSVARELKGLCLHLTHWVLTSGAPSSRSHPYKS